VCVCVCVCVILFNQFIIVFQIHESNQRADYKIKKYIFVNQHIIKYQDPLLSKIEFFRVRLPAETIFFAISLLQFFKIKFGTFGGDY